jgi:hypothetical protein
MIGTWKSHMKASLTVGISPYLLQQEEYSHDLESLVYHILRQVLGYGFNSLQ